MLHTDIPIITLAPFVSCWDLSLALLSINFTRLILEWERYSLFQQCIRQTAVTPAHINDRCVFGKVKLLYECYGSGRVWLKPTLLAITLKSEYLVPMHPFIHKIVIYGYENTA